MNNPSPPPEPPRTRPSIRFGNLFRVPQLTRARIAGAFAIAFAVDALQLALGPLGWAAIDQVLDVIAMVVITWLLGFHVLLLPTVVLEALPLVDMMPTWLGCVAVVVAHRRRQQRGFEFARRVGPSA